MILNDLPPGAATLATDDRVTESAPSLARLWQTAVDAPNDAIAFALSPWSDADVASSLRFLATESANHDPLTGARELIDTTLMQVAFAAADRLA
jgi:hypothetical protein